MKRPEFTGKINEGTLVADQPRISRNDIKSNSDHCLILFGSERRPFADVFRP